MFVQIYVDDIIFGATNEYLYKKFYEMMQNEFDMSTMGEIRYFLDLQIHILKKTPLLIKKSTAKNYSKYSAWTKLRQSLLQWVLNSIWTKIKEKSS